MSELALKLIAENKKTKAKTLDLGNCGLTEVPEEVLDCVWLEALTLGNGSMSANNGPRNAIKQLSYNLSELKSLIQLDAYWIGLKTVDSLSLLVNLQKLNVAYNRITSIEPLRFLNNLKYINLHANLVHSIEPLQGLEELNHIILLDTKIKSIEPLKNLRNLHTIDIRGNQIESIEPILPLIKNGIQVRWYSREKQGIFIAANPWKVPPPEIVKQGNASIIQYFEELERAKKTGSTIRLAEAKCLILGEGGAGKTSLTRKLLNSNTSLPQEKDTTKGINVHPHDLTLADGSVFRLNIWDFGGQEIYHATHQFFLTKRSLYLLLDDTRKDEKTVNDPLFNYWLQIAELYGGGSPLLIIQNEKGDRSKELDLRGMQGRFGFVKDAKAVNLLTCRGLDKVQEAIEFWIKQLPHIGEEQPKAWLDVRRELERLVAEDQRDHISLEEYYRICAQHTIPERERALFLSGYLHDFGAFLHFQDHPMLRKILVLNNQWATDAVYKVLDSEEVKRAFGRFTRRDLKKIWADDRYADQHEDLLALMEKFELCYKLPDEKTETWLAPQLLSVLQPEALAGSAAEPAGTDLQVRYEYEFMPKGLLSQHIVRMHHYVRQPELAWKSGVVFERAGAQALVTEAWGSRKISLRAKGVQAKELLTLLSEDFDRMHERLAGLKVKKMIPCKCKVCGKAVEPHFYEYDDLARRKERGKSTVECKVSYEDVGVVKLLDGVIARNLEPIQLLESGKIEKALRQLAKSDEVILLLSQFTIAEQEYLHGKCTHKEFEMVRNRVISAAMKLA